jgi:transketolase
MHSSTPSDLEALSRRIRYQLVQMSHASGAPHLGSAMSCVDILVAAYWGCLSIDPATPTDPERDRFILSKGHAGAALYAVLAEKGFFPRDWLGRYAQKDAILTEHPHPHGIPGVEWATGSLGHGLSAGLGMALAGRIQGREYKVVVCLSDGECNEGSVWEAALLAPAQNLNRVTVVVDFNKWQATGRSEEVTALAPLREKWAAFGWRTREVDGHSMPALLEALALAPDSEGRPTAIIAHTVKGRGVSFMEDDNNWHYRIPKASEVDAAGKELGVL